MWSKGDQDMETTASSAAGMFGHQRLRIARSLRATRRGARVVPEVSTSSRRSSGPAAGAVSAAGSADRAAKLKPRADRGSTSETSHGEGRVCRSRASVSATVLA